jgi:hypothetical protein
MAAVILAACAAVAVRTVPGILHASPASSPSPSPSPTAPHSASLAVDGRSRATLQVVTGTPALTIGMADLGASGTLLRVTTPAGSSPPRLRTAGTGGATVIYMSTKRASAITVTLNAAVSWRLNLASGTTRTVADLRGGTVTGIAVTKGSDVIDLTLPRPHGSVPVQLAAGASQLLLSLPDGVPARVTAAAGAGEISIDGRNHTGVRSGTVLTTAAWVPGAAGYDIDATAGAARIAVTTRTS